MQPSGEVRRFGMDGFSSPPADRHRYFGLIVSFLFNDGRLGTILTAGVMTTVLAAQLVDSDSLNEVLRFFGAYGAVAILGVWFNGQTRDRVVPIVRDRFPIYAAVLYVVIPVVFVSTLFACFSDAVHSQWIARGLLWAGYVVPTFLATIFVDWIVTQRLGRSETLK